MGNGHDHGSGDGRGPKDSRYLSAALVLLLVFMAAEVIVGIVASSLALITDAAHMLTDAGAIALALVAARLAARPPRGNLTYGLKRLEILSAQANGITRYGCSSSGSSMRAFAVSWSHPRSKASSC